MKPEVDDLTYERVRASDDVIHEWDVYREETGELRTSCGIVFWDRDRSPEMIADEREATCPLCVRSKPTRKKN